MYWHSIEEKELLNKLNVDPTKGLSKEEVKKRLAQYGFNEIQIKDKDTALKIFFRQFKNVLIIILLIATLLSALFGEIFDATLILIIVIFSAGVGFLQEYRAEKAIKALNKMLSPTITLLRDTEIVIVPSREVVPGDIMLLNAGDRIPADARIIESNSLRVDESSLTGESEPVEKISMTLPLKTNITERINMVFSGTTVNYGRAKAVVVSTSLHTEFGKIAVAVGGVKKESTPLEQRTKEVGKWLGIISLSICLFIAIFGIIKQIFIDKLTIEFIIGIMMFAVALAVAAVPEALPAIVTGTLAIGMREMAKNNALIRRMPAVETLGSVTVICADKTGTITKGEMTVRKLYTGGVFVNVSGSGYEPHGEFSPSDALHTILPLINASVLCNDVEIHYKEDKWIVKGDSTEGALLVLAAKAGLDIKKIRMSNPRIQEIPFSAEKKRMSTLNQLENGKKVIFMKGAPEVVVDLCSFELIDKKKVFIDKNGKKKLLQIAEDMAKQGLRVIALASKESEFIEEKDMCLLGFVGIIDPPRPEAIEAIKVCKKTGIKLIMITGDHVLTAVSIASETGIYKNGDMVITGTELQKMSEEALTSIVDKVTVYARVSPMDKLKIVKAWKRKGEIVAMTGDGVNDAPALKIADIGIAMGQTGTEVAKEAADMILEDDNLATIIKAIKLGRWIYDNIKKYLTYLLESNIVEVVVIGGVVLLKGIEYLPLLPAGILFLNLLTDGPPALALGIAPAEPDIMERPPRDPKESIFSKEVKIFILAALIIYVPLFFWIFIKEQDITIARTKIFMIFIIVEMTMALNFRSLRYSIFKSPPHFWLILAVVSSVLFTIILIQSEHIRSAFGISMPKINILIKGLIIAVGVTLIIEFIKKFLLRNK